LNEVIFVYGVVYDLNDYSLTEEIKSFIFWSL